MLVHRHSWGAFVNVVCATAFVFLSGCKPDDESLTHGFVKLKLARSEAATDEPFVGTAKITANMVYEDCLRSFYSSNPNYEQDGLDGTLIFGSLADGGEGWSDRLCMDPESDQVHCEVESIDQNLDQQRRLSVTYNVTDPGLETRFLKFGPLPTEDLAGCLPVVGLDTSPVFGESANGDALWETESFNPDTASTGQGGSIQIRAAIVD